MPLSPSDVAALHPSAPVVVPTADDEAAYELLPPLVDAQLQTLQPTIQGSYLIVLPAEKAAVLKAHPSLVRRLVELYRSASWQVLVGESTADGAFHMTLAPPLFGRGVQGPL